MHEPCADGRGGAGHVLGAVDDDLAGAVAVLAVGGVDDDVGPKRAKQLLHGLGVADLDPLPGRVGREPEQLRAEEPGRAGDVDPHGSGARRLARRCLTNSIRNATENAIASPTTMPFHGCSSNCLPPM